MEAKLWVADKRRSCPER